MHELRRQSFAMPISP